MVILVHGMEDYCQAFFKYDTLPPTFALPAILCFSCEIYTIEYKETKCVKALDPTPPKLKVHLLS